MYNIITIYKPTKKSEAIINVNSLSMIPEFLREAITVVDAKLHFDTISGKQTAPLGICIGYEECGDQTPSGYNCWQVKFPEKKLAMLIPAKEDAKPVWVNLCNLTYNGDGTVTLKTAHGQSTGRIGIDFIMCHGMNPTYGPNASILDTYDESYNDYIICDKDGNDIGKLCELYPA